MRVSIFLVAALAAAAVAVPDDKFGRLVNSIRNAADMISDVICTENFDPVCGSDFKTYSNTCKAKLAGVSVQLQGECPTPVVEPPEFVCGQVFQPVCGIDGITYSNPCFASVAGVKVASEGECPTEVVVDPPAVCPLILAPVCAADGETYDNECLAAAAGTVVISTGRCKGHPLDCFCSQVYSPVCGSDFKTYSNKCFARCAGVEILHPFACELVESTPTAGTVPPPPQTESCEWSCGAQGFNPVCSINGRTFSNACTARCRGAIIASEGACPIDTPTRRPRRTVPPPQTESCEWSCGAFGFAPVCGDDGKTYRNECSTRCRGAAVVSEGECPTDDPVTTVPAGDVCICTKEYLPVCGVDGQTYGNKCEAKCAKVKIAHKGEC